MMWFMSYHVKTVLLIIWISQETSGRPTLVSNPKVLNLANGKQQHSSESNAIDSVENVEIFGHIYNTRFKDYLKSKTNYKSYGFKFLNPENTQVEKRPIFLKGNTRISQDLDRSVLKPIVNRRHRAERDVRIAGFKKRIASPSFANINRSPAENPAVRDFMSSNNHGVDAETTEPNLPVAVREVLDHATDSFIQPHEITRPSDAALSEDVIHGQPHGNIVSYEEQNNTPRGDTSETNIDETLTLNGNVIEKSHDIIGPVETEVAPHDNVGPVETEVAPNNTIEGENSNIHSIPNNINRHDFNNMNTNGDNVTDVDSSEDGVNSLAGNNNNGLAHTNTSDSSDASFPENVHKSENNNGHQQVIDQFDTHFALNEPNKPHLIIPSTSEILPIQTPMYQYSTRISAMSSPAPEMFHASSVHNYPPISTRSEPAVTSHPSAGSNTTKLPNHSVENPPSMIEYRLGAPEQVNQPTSTTQISAHNPDHPILHPDDTESKATLDLPGTTLTSTSPTTTRHAGDTNNNTPLTHITDKSRSSTSESIQVTEPPSSYMELKFSMSWPDFCQKEVSIRGEIVQILQEHAAQATVTADQIQVMDTGDGSESCSRDVPSLISMEMIVVRMYLLNKTHQFDRELTLVCANVLKSGFPFENWKNSSIGQTLLAIHVHDEEEVNPTMTAYTSEDSTPDYRVIIAVILAVVGGCCCVGLIVIQVIVRRRHKENRAATPVNGQLSHDGSDDSIQLASVVKSRPNSGLYNPGLDILDPMEPSNPMNYVQLSNFCMDEKKIAEEFEKLPQRMPRPSMVPMGEEDKNRYANVLPLVHTRVKLVQDDADRKSTYINANYVTGPNNQCQYYIATQAPTEKTVPDFWTMVWQQGCKAIVMLTQMEEHGQWKCASYWPELVGKSAAHKHGDFLIELKQKDVHQEYIVSKLEINNFRKIETREIDHFWYTCWPPNGLPEPISLVKLVLDVRPIYESGSAPLVVHCSPGTGRTCTFIALDLCMHQFETKRMVNVMATVFGIRQERAGAIQNKEQYSLIYHALNEYATIVSTPGAPTTSSVATLQALLTS